MLGCFGGFCLWIQAGNGRDVTKRAIIDVTSIVSGRNYILTSIIAPLLTKLLTCV